MMLAAALVGAVVVAALYAAGKASVETPPPAPGNAQSRPRGQMRVQIAAPARAIASLNVMAKPVKGLNPKPNIVPLIHDKEGWHCPPGTSLDIGSGGAPNDADPICVMCPAGFRGYQKPATAGENDAGPVECLPPAEWAIRMREEGYSDASITAALAE